jgi:hypothetical protein
LVIVAPLEVGRGLGNVRTQEGQVQKNILEDVVVVKVPKEKNKMLKLSGGMPHMKLF